MNAAFGLDHPLLGTHDIDALRAHLIAMGFNMTAIGQHPWGTSTSLAMFEGCLIEIMGIYDAALIDQVPAGDFRFGRHVCDHLKQREGVALTALHSTDSQKDAQTAAEAGFAVAGYLEFGRAVSLPNGTQGQTKTTLALLPDAVFPRLSFFLCQQHRPELVYVSEWLEHPNKVTGICGVNIVAQSTDHARLHRRFTGLYGAPASIDGGLEFTTANGVLRILDPGAFHQTIGPLPAAMVKPQTPFIGGMDLTMSDPETLLGFLQASEIGHRQSGPIVTLTDPAATALTTLRFVSA